MVKVLPFRLQQCLSLFTMLAFEGFSETRLFSENPNNVFRSPYYSKCVSYKGHLFFGKSSKFHLNFKTAKKNPEKYLVSQILVSEFVALNCPN